MPDNNSVVCCVFDPWAPVNYSKAMHGRVLTTSSKCKTKCEASIVVGRLRRPTIVTVNRDCRKNKDSCGNSSVLAKRPADVFL